MVSVLEDIPELKGSGKFRARHHAQILKKGMHRAESLKSKVKKKRKPELGK